MELDIKYDQQNDQFLLFVVDDPMYNLTGRIVAKKKKTADPWEPFDGMKLVLEEYEAVS